MLYKDFDEGEVTYRGALNDEAQLKDFVTVESIPLVMGFDQKAAEAIFGSQKQTLFLLYSNESDAVAQKEVLNQYAAEHKGVFLYSATTVKEGFGSKLGEFLGVP